MKKHCANFLSASTLQAAINERIIGRNAERDRKILKRRLIDGLTFERLAEEFELSTKQITRIVYAREAELLRPLE